MTRVNVLGYLASVESRRAVSRLSRALIEESIVPVAEPVAGGGSKAGLHTRISSAPVWNEAQADKAFKLYLKMLEHDLRSSVLSAYAFLILIACLGAVLALIGYQLALGRFSPKQLAGLPLASFIGLLFKAYAKERNNQEKLRRDLVGGKQLFATPTEGSRKAK
jgi:hypothetical protein